MGNNKQADIRWSGKTDGYAWMHNSLIWMMHYIPVRFFYFISDIVVCFYFVLARKRCIPMYHYWRNKRKNKPFSSLCNTYATFQQFGRVVIDRFATYAGKQFVLCVDNIQAYNAIIKQTEGCILLSSHIGNAEMAGYFLHAQQQMYVLLYDGEKQTIAAHRKKHFEKNNIHFLYAKPDGSHIYAITDILRNGHLFNIFGDRLFGSTKTLTCTLLQASVHLPLGPFALIECFSDKPVYALFVMRERQQHYRLYLKKINGNTKTELAQKYADAMTEIVDKYPTQWFNFYEFWETH